MSGLPQAHLATVGISAAVVAVIVLSLSHLPPQLPGPLFAVVGATAASAVFDFAGHGVTRDRAGDGWTAALSASRW